MTKKRNLIVPALVLGVLLAIVAVVYFVEPAGSLPSVLPGHEAGSAHHHIKHGIAAAAVAAGCFAFAWFQTEPPASRSRVSGT